MSPQTFRDQALRELAQSLAPVQRQLLTNLSDRGPGLLLELAVRQLTFPEQISAPLAGLAEHGLVRGEPFSGGQLGAELYYLTADGQQVVAVLREAAARGESLTGPTLRGAAPPRDMRFQQADLLQKLGDLAAQSGQGDEARQYYKQALELTRTLAEASPSYAADSQP
jgi:hypothetical protein